MSYAEKSRDIIYTDNEKNQYRDYIYDNFNCIVDFFIRNINLTPQSFTGQLAQRPVTSNSNWGEQNEKLESQGIIMHPLWGKCYHAARFFQYLGCWDNFEAYTIYKKIPHILDGEYTTHWFLKDKKTGQILDPTSSQFDYIDITKYYDFGQKASGRLCYYGFNPKYKLWNTFVPPVTTRKFGRKFKEETGSAYALEKWFQEEQWWLDNKKIFYGDVA
jgi:hypothetical protein